jgi:hypothetical protein
MPHFLGSSLRETWINRTSRPHIPPTRLPRPIRSERQKPFDGPEWPFEMKYDGCRGLLSFEGGSGRLAEAGRVSRLRVILAVHLRMSFVRLLVAVAPSHHRGTGAPASRGDAANHHRRPLSA